MFTHITPHRAASMMASAMLLGGLVGYASSATAVPPDSYVTGAEITQLPAHATLNGAKTPAEAVTVKIAVPAGFVCASDFTTRTVGQKQAVSVSAAPDCTVAGFAKWTVTANSITFKRNAVVKFIATSAATGAQSVGTLKIRVNPGAKPANPNPKPAKTHGNGNGKGGVA